MYIISQNLFIYYGEYTVAEEVSLQ